MSRSETVVMNDELVAYCIDVGSTRGRFGWARVESTGDTLACSGGTSIDACVRALREDLQSSACVTFGVEAPLWLPVPRAVADLSRGRDGEGNRSCFAPAGGYVAALGVHQLAYVLDSVRDLRRATTRWSAWSLEARTLLIWEAFVSGPAHTTADDHVADATTAAIEFVERARCGGLTTDVPDVRGQALSLAAGVVLWAGLSDDVAELHEATLVIKPMTARIAPNVEPDGVRAVAKLATHLRGEE